MDLSHKKLNLRGVPIELVFSMTLLEIKSLADAMPASPEISAVFRNKLRSVLADNSLVLSDVILAERVAENEVFRSALEAKQAELNAGVFQLTEDKAALEVKDAEVKDRIAEAVQKETAVTEREVAASEKETELAEWEAELKAREEALKGKEQTPSTEPVS